ncbi:Unknown protein, partial [Striga hermonthica]
NLTPLDETDSTNLQLPNTTSRTERVSEDRAFNPNHRNESCHSHRSPFPSTTHAPSNPTTACRRPGIGAPPERHSPAVNGLIHPEQSRAKARDLPPPDGTSTASEDRDPDSGPSPTGRGAAAGESPNR